MRKVENLWKRRVEWKSL